MKRAGDLPLLQQIAKETAPLTKSQGKLFEAAANIRMHPDAADTAFMARQLVQCTLPHSDPGDLEMWTRTNGNLTLVIARTAYDPNTQKPIGYPYGTIPRLLLFWLTAEAVRTKSRRIELGTNLSDFMRELGLNPRSGTGKKGDAYRLREQMQRLFSAAISFQDSSIRDRWRKMNMEVATRSELWWDPKKPDQGTMWNSWVMLGEAFFEAITQSPVPLDMRALNALKQSPLALDLYSWATYKAYNVSRGGQQETVRWEWLEEYLGSSYSDPKDFRKKIKEAMRKVQSVLPGFKTRTIRGGFIILPESTPAVAPRKKVPV